MVLPYFLVEFGIAHAPRGGFRWARLVALFAAGLGALLLITEPGLLFQGVRAQGGVDGYEQYFAPLYGPLHLYLVQVPIFVAFGVALWLLHAALRAAPTPRVAQRAWILLAGLGLYVGQVATSKGLAYALYASVHGAPLSSNDAFMATLFLGLAALTTFVTFQHFRQSQTARSRPERRLHGMLTAFLGSALVLGAIEAAFVLGVNDFFQTVGLWRLAGFGIIAYGITRWRIYDLPQRAGSAAATATGATAAAATGLVAYGAGSVASASAAAPILAGLLVLVAALVPSVRLARRFFRVLRDEPNDLESALYGQRIEAYRAALEASLARGTLEEDEGFLAALRERFRITPDEDRLLTHLARSSVIVARDRQAWDAYERLRLLGEGGGGRTWLARDRARDRLVVLKEPLERWQQEPGAREAVLREARLAAKVRHPNVVAVEEVVAGKGSPVIVMEYLEGGSLADLLRAKGSLPWPHAQALALDLLRGVEAVHASGIVHRDLKPSNVLLSGEGVAKVADFGIAVTKGPSAERTVVMDTSASTIAGTLHYMAPEARAGAEPDKRADVYGCAAILHEMLYGAPPALRSPTVVRHDLPAGLPAVLARGLAERADARYPSARAMAEDLAKLA